MPLNDSDLAILREAGDHKDHLLFSPSKMKPRSIKALANRLLTSGFAAETVTEAGQPSWRESDGKAIGLQLTPAGLAELGGPAQSRDRLDDVQAAAGNDGSRHQPRAHTKIARVMALLHRNHLHEPVGGRSSDHWNTLEWPALLRLARQAWHRCPD